MKSVLTLTNSWGGCGSDIMYGLKEAKQIGHVCGGLHTKQLNKSRDVW
jgi:hypothetical protein